MEQFKPGDLLLFAGSGAISNFIRFVTCSKYSHIGILAKYTFSDGRSEILLYESTSLNNLPCVHTGKRIEGVQIQYPLERIHHYKGKVWLAKLNPDWELDEEESKKLTKFLIRYVGYEYDTDGAILSRIRQEVNLTDQDLRRLFCSEYTVAALSRIGRFPIDNASKYTPGAAYRKLRKVGMYLKPEQIK